ncbi:MAG: hypothetical protein DMG58_03725 [Acidobacteria bacterium]|nr:MAG: hypothetical protein DMG58_03725 [Acidobacteriota bacterium]
MKLGAERKKVAFLVVLTGAAAYLLYSNVFSSAPGSGSSGSPRPTAARPANSDARPQQAAAPAPTTSAASGQKAASRRTSQEFRPPWKRKTAIETSSIDPKLRLDLLAKVQAVELGPAERNLFQFGVAAAPALPKEPPPIIPKTPDDIRREQEEAAKAAAPPPPPPIPLKYYGYTAQRVDGHKRAFFLDGDDIFVAAEGDMVKRRYKIVRIGVNSAVVEDTQLNNTQTLPLAEESAG